MDINKFLGQAYWLSRQIDAKTERIAHLRELSQKATSVTTASRMGGTSRRSKLEDAVCAIIDLEQEIKSDIVQLVSAQKTISKTIEKVDDPCLKTLLELRFLNFLTWEQISERMMYSYVHVAHRLRPKAFRAAQKVVIECNIAHEI